jgi:2-polyprenyl-3-methyl-5-hydroxy-6-metoxy-1,4-benzoquinol methylase
MCVYLIGATVERLPGDTVMNHTTAKATGSCLICGWRKSHYNFSLNKFRVEECANCGLMRLNPQPTVQELADIYSKNERTLYGDSDGQQHSSRLKSLTADYYLDLLESYAGRVLDGHLLEIGCGYGDFLIRATDRGLTSTGIEHSAEAAHIASERLNGRANVIHGELASLLSSGQRYDFVIFVDRLERERDPATFLSIVRQLLHEDGIAMAIVPSLDSVTAKLMKSSWSEFKPENLWYFSAATLTRLLYMEGFGALTTIQGKKTLSLDYVVKGFDRYVVPPLLARPLRTIRYALPRALQRRPFRVALSEMVTLATRQSLRDKKLLSIVMPAYNEAKSIRGAIERVLSKKIDGVEIELVITESNSTDGTRQIVREYEGRARVKVILQDRPCGKGNAVRAGLKHVSGDYILIQDADDEYDIEDYDALLEPLITGEMAFVLGARHGGGAWKMRQFDDRRLAAHFLNLGHWFFVTLVNAVYGLRLKDPFTMYKVFRTDCLRGLAFECNRFDFDVELLIKLVRKGYRPIEIPVNYRARSFKEGKKIDVFRDPWTWLRAIVKFRVQKL